MSSWAGFSDEELRKIQLKDPAARGRGAAPSSRSRQREQRGEDTLQPGPHLGASAPHLAVREVDELNPPEVMERRQPPAGRTSPGVKELEVEEVELRETTRLEQLQQEQKAMEERNRRTKALLARTIAEKSKQTQEEAVKLKRIQKQLQALDDMVSSDIGILRDRIEEASWEFSAARKRYEKAEAEYVTSKLDLHRKTEVKEQLTEHLHAIIQQNERRKAEKLQELMLQLHAAEAAETGDAPADAPACRRGEGEGPGCQQGRPS